MIGDIEIHFLEDNAQIEVVYSLVPSYQDTRILEFLNALTLIK
jgi:hypothetical protein